MYEEGYKEMLDKWQIAGAIKDLSPRGRRTLISFAMPVIAVMIVSLFAGGVFGLGLGLVGMLLGGAFFLLPMVGFVYWTIWMRDYDWIPLVLFLIVAALFLFGPSFNAVGEDKAIMIADGIAGSIWISAELGICYWGTMLTKSSYGPGLQYDDWEHS